MKALQMILYLALRARTEFGGFIIYQSIMYLKFTHFTIFLTIDLQSLKIIKNKSLLFMKIFVSISFIYLIGINLGCNKSQKHNLNENNIDSYSTQFIELKNNMICIKFLSDSFLFQSGLKESSNYHYNTILQPNCTYNYSVNDFTNQKFDSRSEERRVGK